MAHTKPWLDASANALPLFPGMVSGGVLYGAAASEAGMAPATAILTSLWVATGTAQFVSLELINQGIGWGLVVLVGLLINLRFAVYALHLAPLAEGRKPSWRLPFFAMVTDEGYALTMARAGDRGGLAGVNRKWALMLMMSIWWPWVLGTVLGVGLGRALPTGYGLEWAIPFTLLNVLVMILPSSRHLGVALVAGTVATVFSQAPHGLGFMAGMVSGVLFGLGFGGPKAEAGT